MPVSASRRGRRSLQATACLLLVTAAAAPAPAGEAAPPRLCIEYLPAIVYVDEPVSLCARVESDRERAFAVTAALLDGADRVLASDLARGTAQAETPWRHHSALRPKRGEPARLSVRLTTPNGGRVLDSVDVPVLDGRERLPPLDARGLRLADARGRRVLVRIEHRVWRRKQTWPLIRWIAHKIYGDTWSVDRGLVVGDPLGDAREGYLARLAAARPVPLEALPVPPDGAGTALPVLRAVAALTRAKLRPPPDLAILCLGHRDPDYGADVLQFGKALELALQQLESRGCERAILVGPVGPPHLGRRLAPYVQATRRVAHTYRDRFLSLGSALAREHWVAEGSDGRVLLRVPNGAGHQAMAGAIADFVKEVTR